MNKHAENLVAVRRFRAPEWRVAGARGGRDQFNWENVKSDKDREFYLGYSVKASVGRWQKGKSPLFQPTKVKFETTTRR